LAELEIVGAVDFAHSAFAEKTDDTITIGEDSAGNKTRIVD
jgi:hypothetical protein